MQTRNFNVAPPWVAWGKTCFPVAVSGKQTPEGEEQNSSSCVSVKAGKTFSGELSLIPGKDSNVPFPSQSQVPRLSGLQGNNE